MQISSLSLVMISSIENSSILIEFERNKPQHRILSVEQQQLK